MPQTLPEMPAGLTPTWLTTELQRTGFLPTTVTITSAIQEQVGEGVGMMSELARLRLSYSGDAAGLPTTLMAKFPSRNPTNRQVAMSYNLYERETRYFAELDPLTSARSPTAHISQLQGENFIILMQDLIDYRVGDQVVGATLAETEAMIDELAKLHATFWNNVSDLDWVPHIANSYHAENMDALLRIGWSNMVSVFADYIDPAIAARGEEIIAALPEMQRRMDDAPITLLHGDFRMENVLFGVASEHEPVMIIDWQGPLLGKAMVDVALIMGQSTQIEVRRSNERALIERYADRLAAAGVPDYNGARAWQDYQLALLYNWVYVGVVAGTLDTTNEHGFAWMAQMVARQSAASLDLDLFSLMP